MAEPFKFPHETDDDNIEIEVNDGDVEIEVVDDTPERDRGRKPLDREVADPTEEEIESYSDKVRNRIKELTHARHDERRVKEATMREKQELETFAQRIMDENKTLRGYVDQGNRQVVASSLTAAEAEMSQARRQYKEAQEAFDTDAIIAAQEAMTDAKFKLEAVKNFRPTPLQAQENTVQTPQPAPQRVQPDEKSLRWQAKNQWFGSDGFEDVTSYSLGLHQKLVNSGLDPRSDEYFEQIDARVKSKFPEVFGNSKSEANRRPASVVAPATRSSGVRKVQLTTSAVALAKKFGMTPQQYAAQVAKLEA
jgi:hypothetical protein